MILKIKTCCDLEKHGVMIIKMETSLYWLNRPL